MLSSLWENVESTGSVAERSKVLVQGTSHFDGVGSNPTATKSQFWRGKTGAKQIVEIAVVMDHKNNVIIVGFLIFRYCILVTVC